MQHPRPDPLCQDAREKRRNRPPRTPQRRHSRQTAHLQPLGDQFRKHSRGARIHGTEQESHDGDGDGLADDIRHEPDEELKGRGAEDECDDGAFLAEFVCRVREGEAAERDAGPEARRDVADAGGGGVPVGDEEGDDPAGDGDLGALVAEDEEGAEDGGFVCEGGFEEFGARVGGGGGVRVGRGRVEEVDRGGVFFVGAEGEEGEGEVEEGHG